MSSAFWYCRPDFLIFSNDVFLNCCLSRFKDHQRSLVVTRLRLIKKRRKKKSSPLSQLQPCDFLYFGTDQTFTFVVGFFLVFLVFSPMQSSMKQLDESSARHGAPPLRTQQDALWNNWCMIHAVRSCFGELNDITKKKINFLSLGCLEDGWWSRSFEKAAAAAAWGGAVAGWTSETWTSRNWGVKPVGDVSSIFTWSGNAHTLA